MLSQSSIALFILASYAFARREKDKAIELCESIQTSYPGYDPSKRFSSLPSPQDDLVTLMKEAHLAQDAEGFLKRFLTTYSGYTFSDFSPSFISLKTIFASCFLLKLQDASVSFFLNLFYYEDISPAIQK